MAVSRDQKIKLLSALTATSKLTETEYNTYLKRDEWNELDVIRLFHQEDIDELIALMRASINAGIRLYSRRDYDSRSFIVRRNQRDYAYIFAPLTIIDWAIGKQLRLPEELLEWHEKQSKPAPAATPPYLDTTHPLHSSELAIVIEAWMEVLQSNPNRPKTGSRKQLIENWLATHYPKLKQAEIGRIAVMINPDKKH